MAQNIRHISTTTVWPKSHDHLTQRSIELTPWDLRLIQLDYIQKGLLFKKSADRQLNHSLIQHIKASLSLTLDIFYPLAGRLAVTENEDYTGTCFSIDCNGDGALFVHAAADCVRVADILDPIYVPDDIVSNLFSMNGVLNYEGVSKPLLAVQVTELVDGIFIGCTINHSVVDGSSFWHFFNTWSEISRTKSDDISQPPPIFSRQFLDGVTDLPIPMPFSYSEIPDQPTLRMSTNSLQRVFHFSKGKIAQLKSKANGEMGTSNISSLQALMAHFWRAITRCGQYLNPDQESVYRIVVGLRQKLKPPLPKEYLGNVLLGVVVKSTAGELLQYGLGWAALQINKMIASLTAEEVKKLLEDWLKTPIIHSNMRDNIPTRTTTSSTVSLLTGSSPRFNVYGNDFGGGDRWLCEAEQRTK